MKASLHFGIEFGRPHLGQQLAILGFINGKVGPAMGTLDFFHIKRGLLSSLCLLYYNKKSPRLVVGARL